LNINNNNNDNEPRIMKLVGHVTCVGDKSNASKVAVGRLKERNHLEDVRIDDSVILNRT
jgi:hypothetical protein